MESREGRGARERYGVRRALTALARSAATREGIARERAQRAGAVAARVEAIPELEQGAEASGEAELDERVPPARGGRTVRENRRDEGGLAAHRRRRVLERAGATRARRRDAMCESRARARARARPATSLFPPIPAHAPPRPA